MNNHGLRQQRLVLQRVQQPRPRSQHFFARVAYNSLDTSDTVSGPRAGHSRRRGRYRLGAPLDFHPNPHPTEIRLPDGDGTTHVFRKHRPTAPGRPPPASTTG
ncbi:DNRLRE domain-containing protein [Streptomyces tanashiensis]